MSIIAGLLGALGIGAASKVASGVIDPAMTGVGNLISGGNWKQDGNTLEQNKFNAEEAQKTRDFNQLEAEKNRAFQAEQAQLQRDYQTQMSNTAYQRAIKDMEAAGINPAMAYSNGASPASTPAGASASGSAASGSAASASNSHSRNTYSDLLHGVANIANVMNNDKHKDTKMGFYDAMGMINTVAKLIK